MLCSLATRSHLRSHHRHSLAAGEAGRSLVAGEAGHSLVEGEAAERILVGAGLFE